MQLPIASGPPGTPGPVMYHGPSPNVLVQHQHQHHPGPGGPAGPPPGLIMPPSGPGTPVGPPPPPPHPHMAPQRSLGPPHQGLSAPHGCPQPPPGMHPLPSDHAGNRIPGLPPPPPALPQYFGLDYKIYELNKRLQQRSEDADNAALWWDAFASEFFEDDATLTITFLLDKGPQRYTIGRMLIPRFFRSIYEGGAVQMYFLLNMPTTELFHQARGMLVLDCQNAVMVTHYSKAMTNVLVHTEGSLICEFAMFPGPMGDELLPGRIRAWNFFTRQYTEFIPRSVFTMNNMDQGAMEQISQSVTMQGFMKTTLSFLGLCVILEPMQELMSRSRTYPNMTPRDCLTTTAFQKWQEMNAAMGARQPRPPNAIVPPPAAAGLGPPAHPMLPPEEGHKTTKARRKRKGSNSGGATPTGSGQGGGKKKNAASPAPAAPNFPLTSHVDVMVVSEPSLMGGEFGEEDERAISRLENTQYDPSAAAAQVGIGVGIGGVGPSSSLGGPLGIPLPTSGGIMGLQAMTENPNLFEDWRVLPPPPQSHGPSISQQHAISGGGPPTIPAGSGSNPNTPLGRTATPASNSNGGGTNQQSTGVRTPGGSSSPAQPQPLRPLSTTQNGSRQGTPNALAGGQGGSMTPTSYV